MLGVNPRTMTRPRIGLLLGIRTISVNNPPYRDQSYCDEDQDGDCPLEIDGIDRLDREEWKGTTEAVTQHNVCS